MARGRLLQKCVTIFFLIISPSFCIDEGAGGKSDDYEFDFIIVGGGTAGCVVASRLSENGRYSVLVLEAGGDPPEILKVPAFADMNRKNPNFTFQYQSVPQKRAAQGTNGGVLKFSTGRVLGGTSQINSMVFNRCSPFNYDDWGNLTGDPSWEYSNMLQYFRKMENYTGEFPDATQHGLGGPITISAQKYAPGKEAWLLAGQELGFPIKDPNGPQQISFGPTEFSKRFGRRVSSYDAYIKPILTSRGNLRIERNAHVNQVLFQGYTAIGVRYDVNGSYPQLGNVALAKREVIISAGAYDSATLLMRSGIGPREVLEPIGIPVIKELPVGQNFQNHPGLPIYVVLNNKSLSFDPDRDLTPEAWELYERFGEGPYTYSNPGLAFLASSLAMLEGHPLWSDMYLLLFSTTTRGDLFKDNFVADWETTISVNSYLGREKSRGSVKLDPLNPNGMPLIDFNYLEDPRDEDRFLEAINLTLKLVEETETYRSLGARLFREPLKACAHLEFRSEAYWRCYIRQATISANHLSGTCSMSLVVDSKLRVIGIERLRVVDASIIPSITNANMQAPVYGIAEKASDMILDEHSKL